MPAKSLAIKQDVLAEVRKHVRLNLVLDSRSMFGYIRGVNDETIKKNWHNIDVANIQKFSSHRLFKLFAANDSSFSSSLETHVRMLFDEFLVTAYKRNGTPYADGQVFIDDLKARLNYTDRYDGFSEPNTIGDQIMRMGRNILTSDNAAAALYLQLNNDYTVEDFRVVDCDRVYFEPIVAVLHPSHALSHLSQSPTKDKKRRPYIYDAGRKISLDYANFLWQPLDSDAGEIMGNNPLRPGLKTTFTKMEFLDNLRKVLNNQAWPKIKVVMDEEATLKMAPPEVRQDSKKLIAFLNDYLSKVEAQLTGMAVDQNIIVYDTIKEIGFLETKGKKLDLAPIAKLLDSELISSFKSPPSTVGKGGSTRTGEGLASAELVMFRRQIKALRRIVETIYSRAFTLAMQLAAYQGYVKFRLKEFTLRPPEESAQFDSIRQETILIAWESGAIGDVEKDKKIRHMHGLDGPAPEDAEIREKTTVNNRQTERGADAERQKEEKRSQTRKNQKTGSDRKS